MKKLVRKCVGRVKGIGRRGWIVAGASVLFVVALAAYDAYASADEEEGLLPYYICPGHMNDYNLYEEWGLYGLQDMEGRLFDARYKWPFHNLNEAGSVIAISTSKFDTICAPEIGEVFHIFDLSRRKYVYANNKYFRVTRTEAVSNTSHALYDEYHRWFATVYLPNGYNGMEDWPANVEVRPEDDDNLLSIEMFMSCEDRVDPDIVMFYYNMMKEQAPSEFAMMKEYTRLCGESLRETQEEADRMAELLSRIRRYTAFREGYELGDSPEVVMRDRKDYCGQWYRERTRQVGAEYDVLVHDKPYAATKSGLRTDDDIYAMLKRYHREGYYHPMWDEIWSAVDAWHKMRAEVACGLEGNKRRAYEALTAETTDWLYRILKSVDDGGFIDW